MSVHLGPEYAADKETVNPILSIYRHGTSREGDPQLHSHAFLHNIAWRNDGSYGSLETRDLYRWKQALGAIYRAELASELQQMGYKVQRDDWKFHIAGIEEKDLKNFSQRRQQIETAMEAAGSSGGRAAEIAALATRQKKGQVDFNVLRKGWKDQARAQGLELPREGEPDTKKTMITVSERDELLSSLVQHSSTFQRQDLIRALAESAPGRGWTAADIGGLADGMIENTEIVQVQQGIYTTREQMQIESTAIARAGAMAEAKDQGVDQKIVNSLAEKNTLTDEQRKAVAHITSAGQIAVVEGGAGTGKTRSLDTARAAWEAAGYQVRGAALAGKAADQLSKDAHMPAQTVHSLLADLESGRDRLTEKSVLVIDEAAMLGSRQTAELIAHVENSGAKLVLVGDSHQLQSIDAGGLFSAIGDRIGRAEITAVRRQREQGEREAVGAMREGDFSQMLNRLQEQDRLHVAANRDAAIAAMVKKWSEDLDHNNPGESLMIAATRADVRALNKRAQAAMAEIGRSGGNQIKINNEKIAEGDRIRFTRNNRDIDVKNGMLASVITVSPSRGEITARTDAGQIVKFSVDDYEHVQLGYAVTGHASQGATVDRSYVLHHESMSSAEWSYVAQSRHRESVHMFTDSASISQHSYQSERGQIAETMARQMSRSSRQKTAVEQIERKPDTRKAPESTPRETERTPDSHQPPAPEPTPQRQRGRGLEM